MTPWLKFFRQRYLFFPILAIVRDELGDNTEEKNYEKEEKTQGIDSADLQKKREIWLPIFS